MHITHLQATPDYQEFVQCHCWFSPMANLSLVALLDSKFFVCPLFFTFILYYGIQNTCVTSENLAYQSEGLFLFGAG